MCATWNKEYDPNLIAKKLEETQVFDNPGNHVAFQGPYEDSVSVLYTSLSFSDVIAQTERRRIIGLSIREAAIAGVISSKVLLREISKQENAYLRRAVRKLVLVTSLSIRHDGTLNNALVSGAAIRFTPQL